MTNPFVLTNSQAGDLAVTAAEGGTGYWGRLDTYKPSRWIDDDSLEPKDVDNDFVFYTMRDMDPDPDDRLPVVDVTPALIKRGWRKAVSDYRHVLDLDDPAGTDATGADVIVQLGAWGKVVYG